VRDDLEVRVLWFQDGPDSAACIVTADVIGFGEALTSSLRQAIQIRYGLAPSRVLLAASHTHSGPQTCENMVAVGAFVPETVAMVFTNILEAIAEAHEATIPVSLSVGKGLCSGYAINRRGRTPSGVLNAPNPEGVRDDEVTAIICREAEDGPVRAILYHFTCHATLMGDYAITGDYPAAARRYIEQEFGESAVAAFLPGCFGDVRPNCTVIGGEKFRMGQTADLLAFGQVLGREVIRITHEKTQTVSPRLGGRNAVVTLRLSHHPERSVLETLTESGTLLEKAWAAHLLASPLQDTRQLTLQRLDLADEITLLAMGGEICCDYGLAIKRRRPDGILLPLGYSNGLVGYICTPRLFLEGGYEPDTSTPFFGLPSSFVPDIEDEINSAIDQLMSEKEK
jgi:hypothetical protein